MLSSPSLSSMLNSKIRWSLYLFLIILRFWGALHSQHGYIHPDEFFQGGQELFFGCPVLDSSYLQPRTSTTSPGGDKSNRGTGDEKDGEDIDYIVRNVPWEFEPKNALRSIVPPAFMTLLPLRFYSATTSEKLLVLMNGNPNDTSRSDLESIEGENEPSCPDVSSRQSSAKSLSQLLMPSTAMQTLSGKEILIIPRIFMTFLSFLFLDLPLWIMVLVSQSNSAHVDEKSSIQSSGTNSDATTNENALHASERKTIQIATQNTFAPPIEVIILASSWPCLVFGVRPFTNNLEAMILSFLLLTMFLEIANNRHGTFNNFITSITIGMSCAIGIFVRFTFAFYAFPAVLSFLWVRSKKANGHIIFNVLVNGMQMLCSFAITASMFIYVDTQYYSQQQEVDNMEMHRLEQHNEMIGDVNENLILKSYTKFIAPLNAFLYNSKSKNLAEHGLHPRITHAVVNMPMLFGPLALVGFASAFQTLLGGYRRGSSRHDTSIFRYICHWVIVSGLFILSCAPHQEPRFLLPCLVPMVFLYGREAVGMERCDSTNAAGAAATMKAAAKGRKSKTNIIRLLRVVWIVFNLVLYLFFGWLHQGGLITSLRELPRNVSTSAARPEDVSRNNPLPVIIYYHTYMPPTFLTRQRGSSSDSCDKRDFNVDGTCSDEFAWTKSNNGECGDSHSQSCGRHSILDLRGSDPTILSSLLRKLLSCARDAQDVADASSSGNEEMQMVYIVSPPVVVSSLRDLGRKGIYNYSFRQIHGFEGHVSTEDWPMFHGSIQKFVKELELAVYEVHCWEE